MYGISLLGIATALAFGGPGASGAAQVRDATRAGDQWGIQVRSLMPATFDTRGN